MVVIHNFYHKERKMNERETVNVISTSEKMHHSFSVKEGKDLMDQISFYMRFAAWLNMLIWRFD